MPRDYSWARRILRRDQVTIGELGWMLGVGRHQARRRLLASGLPYKLVTRRWKDPWYVEDHWYVRRTYAIPARTARIILWRHIERDGRQDLRKFRIRLSERQEADRARMFRRHLAEAESRPK